MNNRMKSMAFISPKLGKGNSALNSRYALYKEEKDILKAEFAAYGNEIDWNDHSIQKKLHSFARQIIRTTIDQVNQDDLVNTVLPGESIGVGETLSEHELSGMNVYFGTYGGAVRMSRPQFTGYTAAPQLKEVGIKLILAEIQSGKYSASQLADYTTGLITAWRNRLLFTTTLGGMTAYGSGGAQYTAGSTLTAAKMLTGIDTLTDEAEVKSIIGRRNAIHQLADQTGFSNETKREFETSGKIGTYAGMPVMKVNSFTDNDYGLIYPFAKDSLWMFSDLPAGKWVQAGPLRTGDETVLSSETLNLYFRWDDGYAIWHTDRIAHIGGIS